MEAFSGDGDKTKEPARDSFRCPLCTKVYRPQTSIATSLPLFKLRARERHRATRDLGERSAGMRR
jgi:hypothetical protein